MHTSVLEKYFGLLRNDGFVIAGGHTSDGGRGWWKVKYTTPERVGIYIYFSVNQDNLLWDLPFNIQPSSETCRQAVSHYLLRLNYVLKLGRFAFNEHDDVSLIIDLLATKTEFNTLKTIFNIMRVYYEQYYLPIYLLMTNETLARSWLASRPAGEDLDIGLVA